MNKPASGQGGRDVGFTSAVDARRVDAAALAGPTGDEFTYTVLLDPADRRATPAGRDADERRISRRQRTRLRSGKIVDPEDRFVTECLVHDLSSTGGRIRLPAGVALPRTIQFYDDQTGALHQAVVLWRRDRDAGIQFKPKAATPQSAKVAAEMRRKFYAVRD